MVYHVQQELMKEPIEGRQENREEERLVNIRRIILGNRNKWEHVAGVKQNCRQMEA